MKRRTRSDAHVVKQIAKGDSTIHMVRSLMNTPLIYIDSARIDKIGAFAMELLVKQYGENARPFKFYANLAIDFAYRSSFDEVVIYLPPLYFVLNTLPPDNLEYTVFSPGMDSNEYEYCFSFVQMRGKEANVFLRKDMLDALASRDMGTESRKKKVLKAIEENYLQFIEKADKNNFCTTKIHHIVTATMSIFMWVENCDKRPVAVRNAPDPRQTDTERKKKAKEKKLKPWLSDDSVTIEFLDELPVERERLPHQGGHHTSPRPHFRRGHFRTLNSEKYAHHPLFGVHKGVYVKASYIGPEQTNYQGKEYRICRVSKDA